MRIFIITVFTLIFLNACKKAQDKNSIEGNLEHGVSLTVNVSGIDLENNNRTTIARSVKTSKKRIKTLYSSILSMNDGTEAILSLTEEDVYNDLNSDKSVSEKFANTSLMEEGKTYLVAFYDEENNYITHINAISGSEAKISNKFKQNKTYKWFAYSFNDKSNLSLDNTVSPSISSVGNRNLIYASGEIVTNKNENHLNIIFKHQTAAIELVVDGRGLFDKIIDIELETTSETGLKSGNFDLKTGRFISGTIQTYNTTLSNDDFQTLSQMYGDTIRKAELYTVDTINAIAGFSVKIKKLTQPTDLYSKSSSFARTFTNVIFALPTSKHFVPKIGKKYQVVFTPLYRAVEVGGVEWAYGDLYFDFNKKLYAFHHHLQNYYNYNIDTGEESTDLPSEKVRPHWNSYWNFNSRKPGGGEKTHEVDPCTLVFPKGRWKTPSASDFDKLLNSVEDKNGGIPRRWMMQRPGAYQLEFFMDSEGGFPYQFENTDEKGFAFMALGFRNGTDNKDVQAYSGQISILNRGYYRFNPDDGRSGLAFVFYRQLTGYTTANFTSLLSIQGGRIKCVRDKAYNQSFELF